MLFHKNMELTLGRLWNVYITLVHYFLILNLLGKSTPEAYLVYFTLTTNYFKQKNFNYCTAFSFNRISLAKRFLLEPEKDPHF